MPTLILVIILNMVKVISDVHQKFLTGNHTIVGTTLLKPGCIYLFIYLYDTGAVVQSVEPSESTL